MNETPLALARKAADALSQRGVPNPRHDAEALLAHVLGIQRLELYLQFERPLTGAEIERYREVVRRRRKREPLQYIVGEVGFRDLVLEIDRRVLIPRPETEMLVGTVLDWAAARPDQPESEQPGQPELKRPGRMDAGGGDPGERMVALEVGTGSGAIALSLAKEGPFRSIVATDVSAAALELMATNARRAGVAERVEPRRGSLWEPVKANERFDVIVSNPPYVPEADRAGLAPEVRDWEPVESLFAEEGGLRNLFALIEGAPGHLRPGGLLALEVGEGQAHEMAARMKAAGDFGPVDVIKDLTDRERIIRAEARDAA